MILVFIFLLLGFVFSRIGVEVKDFNLDNKLKKVNTKFNIKIKLKLYGIIPVFKVSLNEDGIKILGVKIEYDKIKDNDKVKDGLDKIKGKLKISNIKLLKPNLETINVKLTLGTESITVTSFLVTIASVFLSYVFKKNIKKFDEKKYKYVVSPSYADENKILFQMNGKFNIRISNFFECIKLM